MNKKDKLLDYINKRPNSLSIGDIVSIIAIALAAIYFAVRILQGLGKI
jgi:hypothetical protein